MAKRPTQSLTLDDGNEYEFFGRVFYGVCDTASGTAAKVVSIPGFTSDSLVAGVVVYVKFSSANTAGSPTLNVTNTGAKNIRYTGSIEATVYEWSAGQVLAFVYDGTYWIILDHGRASTTYYGLAKLSSSTTSTSTVLAANSSAVNAVRQMIPANAAALSITDEGGYFTGDTVEDALQELAAALRQLQGN